MRKVTQFASRCEDVFSREHGRRWKAACAQEFGISRATLYRYLRMTDEAEIPADILKRLSELEQPDGLRISPISLLSQYCRLLVELQNHLDKQRRRFDLAPSLMRVFDLAAAVNSCTGQISQSWPTDLADLIRRGRQPLSRWCPLGEWDSRDELEDAILVDDAGPTADCYRLAAESNETEITENAGYRLVREVCSGRSDAQTFYVAWRRLTIERPVLTIDEIWKSPSLFDGRLKDLIDTFYQEVPATLAIDGRLPICRVSGTILRQLQRASKGWGTEGRDPEARRCARAGECEWIKYHPGLWQLRRPFRMFWCLPGKAELMLEKSFEASGWRCELWPNFDEVDLVAEFPRQKRKLAIDVKDYLSPLMLARRFDGFSGFERTHRCIVAVPDYVVKLTAGYERLFRERRASLRQPRIELRTFSDLAKEFGLS
jgi:hypothetical protein